MEMTLTVHLPRRRPRPVDVVVEWSGRRPPPSCATRWPPTSGEPVPSLTSGGRPVPPDAEVGMPPLLHGASVTVAPHLSRPARRRWPRPPVSSTWSSWVGRMPGRSHPLRPPGVTVGRAPGCRPARPRRGAQPAARHRRRRVARGHRGGLRVDQRGGRRRRPRRGAPPPSTCGPRSWWARRRCACPVPRAPVPRSAAPATVRSSSPPRPRHAPVTDEVEIACPAAPPERTGTRVPWVAAVAPVPVAIALAFFLGPQLLLFAALGPVSLLAGALGDRVGSRRQHRRALAAHEREIELGPRQPGRRPAAASASASTGPIPTPPGCSPRPSSVEPGCGAARPACVRLGTGELPTRVAWVEGTARSHPLVGGAPLVVDLDEMGCLGVVGPPEVVDGAAVRAGRSALRGPSPAPAHGLGASSPPPSWSWLARLPHTRRRVASGLAGGDRRRGRRLGPASPPGRAPCGSRVSSTVSAARRRRGPRRRGCVRPHAAPQRMPCGRRTGRRRLGVRRPRRAGHVRPRPGAGVVDRPALARPGAGALLRCRAPWRAADAGRPCGAARSYRGHRDRGSPTSGCGRAGGGTVGSRAPDPGRSSGRDRPGHTSSTCAATARTCSSAARPARASPSSCARW